MSLLPIFLKLTSRRCVVIGAGKIAAEKIHSLLQSEADVHVIAPQALAEIQSLAAEQRITWDRRAFEPSDVEGAFLIIAATNLPSVNHHVYQTAVARNMLCNAVDDPPNCDFYFGSVVRRGDLQVAISTAGESPASGTALAPRNRRAVAPGSWPMARESRLTSPRRAGRVLSRRRTQDAAASTRAAGRMRFRVLPIPATRACAGAR